MSAKQVSDASLTPCTECGEMVEGKRNEVTSKGLIWYDTGKGQGFTHSHRSRKFYEQRSINAKNKPKPVEKALAKLLLNPEDKKALQILRKWRADKLFALATDPTKGYASIRAMTKLIEEFTGEPEEQSPGRGFKRATVSLNQAPLAAETPRPKIVIHMLDPAEPSTPRYDPLAVKQDVIEEDYKELPEEFYNEETTEKQEWIGATVYVWPDGKMSWKQSDQEMARLRRPINPYSNMQGRG